MRILKILVLWMVVAVLLAACANTAAPAGGSGPTVAILLPASGGIYAEGESLTLQIEAHDDGAGVARVVLFVDDARFAEERAPNAGGQATFGANFFWTANAIGPHELKVIAYRADGTAGESDRILVSVNPPTETPVPSPTPTDTPPVATETLPPPTATEAPIDESAAEADDSGAAVIGGQASAAGNGAQAGAGETAAGVLWAVTRIGSNVREGPGTDYPVVFTLLPNTEVEVIGRDFIQGWYEIQHYPDPNNRAWVREGWIFWENLEVAGDGAAAAVVQVSPPPPGGGPTPVDPNAPPLPTQGPTSAPEPLVALASPITGTGFELCENPNMLGPQVHYNNWLNGVAGWWMDEYVGVQLEGGITEGVRSQWRDPNNVVLIGQYLLGRYGSTAVEMGGTWRVFYWAVGQSDIPVQAGRQYTLVAIFHPFVQIVDAAGQEVWANAGNNPDWANLLQWRWVVTGSAGNEIADFWRNGTSLGTTTWELPPDQEHFYRFSFAVNRGDEVEVRLEFRNTWPIAVTKVWMHAGRCYEF